MASLPDANDEQLTETTFPTKIWHSCFSRPCFPNLIVTDSPYRNNNRIENFKKRKTCVPACPVSQISDDLSRLTDNEDTTQLSRLLLF